MGISFIRTPDGTIAASVDNQPLPPIGKDHPNYEAVVAALKAGDGARLKQLVDVPTGVRNFTEGKVEVRDGVVYYGGEPLHNALTDRILGLMREGFDFAPMLRFLENLLQNPASSAVRELYDFLAHRALPVTEDGCFLAYKRVRDDWTDVFSGKFDNHVGKIVEMVRNQVDDNRSQGCSYGLHVGTIEYVKGYSAGGNGGHVVIVKVNPKDVVSVPTESNCTKLRCCRYEVVDEYKGDLLAALYTATGLPAQPKDHPDDGVHAGVYDDDDDDGVHAGVYDDDDDDGEDDFDDDVDDDGEDDFDDDDDDDDDEDGGFDVDDDEDDDDDDFVDQNGVPIDDPAPLTPSSPLPALPPPQSGLDATGPSPYSL